MLNRSINIYKQNIYHAQGETLASLCHSVSQFHHLSQPPRPLKLCELETAMKACLMTYDVQDMHIHDLWFQFPPLILIFGPSNLDATLLDRPAMIPVLLCGMRNLAAICRPWHQGPTLASMQSSLNKMRQKKEGKESFQTCKGCSPCGSTCESENCALVTLHEQPGKDNLLEQHQASPLRFLFTSSCESYSKWCNLTLNLLRTCKYPMTCSFRIRTCFEAALTPSQSTESKQNHRP